MLKWELQLLLLCSISSVLGGTLCPFLAPLEEIGKKEKESHLTRF